jgi:hypothetical protein
LRTWESKGIKQLIDLIWLLFRSPHCELAAGMMRTAEPPHEVPSPSRVLSRYSIPEAGELHHPVSIDTLEMATKRAFIVAAARVHLSSLWNRMREDPAGFDKEQEQTEHSLIGGRWCARTSAREGMCRGKTSYCFDDRGCARVGSDCFA